MGGGILRIAMGGTPFEKILYRPNRYKADHQRFGFKMTYPVGYTILQTEDTMRKRPLILDIWYPGKRLLQRPRTITGSAPGRLGQHGLSAGIVRVSCGRRFMKCSRGLSGEFFEKNLTVTVPDERIR